MLNLMREKAGSWIIKVILGAIIVVFVLSYGVMRGKQQVGRVALVNGEPITVEEYREAYSNIMEQLRQRFGNKLNDDMIKVLQVKSQALNQIIDKKLLLEEASRHKFRVSNRELVGAIHKMNAFQTAGVFNNRLYNKTLKRNRLTPEKFELLQRESMLIEKLRSFITGSVKISDQEAWEWFGWSNASVNIDFVLFEPSSYEGIKPSTEEVKDFFDNYKESYKTDIMIKARYMYFEPNMYRSRITITDEEIQDYYEANLEDFKTPKTVEARHILIRVDHDASPELVEKKRIKAFDILKMAKEGKDFAELAKQYSEGPTKDKGGYLGAFKKEAMVKPFADKAFSMKAEEISEPVRTRFGWHLIKVEKIHAASTLSLDQADKTIRKQLTDERAKSIAYDEAEAVYDASLEGDGLMEIAAARNLNILTTDFFTQQEPEISVVDSAKFASAAFMLPVMEVSDILELGEGYCILQVIEKVPERIPEFKDVEEKVTADLKKKKQDEKASKDANTLLSALKNGKSMSKESKHFGFTPITTGFFKRNDSIPKIGFEEEITRVAFQLSNEKKFSVDVIKGKRGYYVINFRERKAPDPKGFDKETEKIKERLLQQKEFNVFDALLAQIRSRSEISIEDDFLK